MNSKITKEVLRKLAIKYSLPEYRIEDIVRSQYEYFSTMLDRKKFNTFDFESLQLIGLGKFFVNPKRIKQIEKHVAIKKQKELENDLPRHEVLC